MTDLSPAAQAVLDAFLNGYICNPEFNVAFESDRNGLAAALRATADQVVSAEPENEDLDPCNPDDKAEWAQYCQRQHTRAELLAIAAELEAQP